MQRFGNMKRWQLMFLLEGLPVIPLGVVTYFFLDKVPNAVQCKSIYDTKEPF